MFKKLLTVFFLFLFLATYMWADFFQGLSMEERKRLAADYYAVGQQYKKIGKTAKGQDFIQMAYVIFPQFSPQMARVDPFLLTTSRAEGTWKPQYAVTPAGITPANAIKFQFAMLYQALLTEDEPTFLQLIDAVVYGNGVLEYTKSDIQAQLETLFDQYDFDSLAPSKILDLTTLKATAVNESVWKLTVKEVSDPAFDLSFFLPRTNGTYTFYYKKAGPKWLLFATGKLPEAMVSLLSPEKSITATFLACLEAFKAKDAPRTASFFSEEVQNIPLGKVIHREELIESFEGFFQEISTPQTIPQIDVNLDETLSTPSQKVYLVTPHFPDTEKLHAFWRTYIGYYFIFDPREKSWKISAIF